jgi:hypothetical protein
VLISGIIDRIDRRAERYRVIDYKSGGVKQENVSVSLGKGEPLAALLKKVYDRNGKNLVLQLLIYCYLFQKEYGRPLDEVGIFSFINTSESPFWLDFKGELSLEEATGMVEELVQAILQDVYDTETPFKHRPDAQYCLYCGQ